MLATTSTLLRAAYAAASLSLIIAGTGSSPPSPGSAVEAGGPACASDLDCHLNGRCAGGICVCDTAWVGSTCGALDLRPVEPLQMGFVERNATSQTTSWGGNAVRGEDGRWHMFVSEIANGCSLKDWTTNSQVVHATSDDAGGPYRKDSVALPAWAHEPQLVVQPTAGPSRYVLFHVGLGTPVAPPAKCHPPPLPEPAKTCPAELQVAGYHCYIGRCAASKRQWTGGHYLCGSDLAEPRLQCSGAVQCAIAAAAACNSTAGCVQFMQTADGRATKLYDNASQLVANGDWTAYVKAATTQRHVSPSGIVSTTAGSTVHTAASLNGPWTPVLGWLASSTQPCTNPAPFLHPNGTFYLRCIGGDLHRAPAGWPDQQREAPWAPVAQFPTKASLVANGVPGHYEDPILYMDRRGHWHVIWHVYNSTTPCGACTDSTVSGHHFSADGVEWHASKVQPYTNKVEFTNGSVLTVATRERPKLIFDPITGDISHLSTGTCVAASCAPVPAVNCKTQAWDYTLVQPVGQRSTNNEP